MKKTSNLKKQALALMLFTSTAVLITGCGPNDENIAVQDPVDPVTVVVDPITPVIDIDPNLSTSNAIIENVDAGDLRAALEVVRNNNDYSFESIVYAIEKSYQNNNQGLAYDFVSLYEKTAQSDGSKYVSDLGNNPIIIAASSNNDYYTLLLAMEKMPYTYPDVNFAIDDAYISKAGSVASDIIDLYQNNPISESASHIKSVGTNRILINASNFGDFNTVLSAMEKMDYTFSDVVEVVKNAYYHKNYHSVLDVVEQYKESDISSGQADVAFFNENPIIKLAADNRDVNAVIAVMENMPYTFDDVAYAVAKTYEHRDPTSATNIMDVYQPTILSDSTASIERLGYNPVMRLASDNLDFDTIILAINKSEYTRDDVSYAVESARSIGFESSAQDILEADKRNDCRLGNDNQLLNNKNNKNPFAVLNCNNGSGTGI